MYLLTYVINEAPLNLLDKISQTLQLEDERHNEMKQTLQNNGFLEFRLFNEEVNVDYSEQLSYLKFYIKYGQFLMSQEVQERILSFEKKLSNMLKNQFFRVDESLIEDYQVSISNEYWYKEEKAFKKFSEWITIQEELHWKKII